MFHRYGCGRAGSWHLVLRNSTPPRPYSDIDATMPGNTGNILTASIRTTRAAKPNETG
jgi:hypothetical protein